MGLTFAELALESRHQRARGQPEQERQQQSKTKRMMAERAGTRIYSHLSAFSWERQPLRQLKNRTLSNHSALLASSLEMIGCQPASVFLQLLIQPVTTEVEEVMIFAGITVGRGRIVLALKPAALQPGLVVPDVD